MIWNTSTVWDCHIVIKWLKGVKKCETLVADWTHPLEPNFLSCHLHQYVSLYILFPHSTVDIDWLVHSQVSTGERAGCCRHRSGSHHGSSCQSDYHLLHHRRQRGRWVGSSRGLSVLLPERSLLLGKVPPHTAARTSQPLQVLTYGLEMQGFLVLKAQMSFFLPLNENSLKQQVLYHIEQQNWKLCPLGIKDKSK